MENNEESEKYEQFESELLNENDFVKKIFKYQKWKTTKKTKNMTNSK